MVKGDLNCLREVHMRADLQFKKQAVVRNERYDKLPHSVPIQVGERVINRVHYAPPIQVGERVMKRVHHTGREQIKDALE